VLWRWTTLIANEPGLLAEERITKVPIGLPTNDLMASFFDQAGCNQTGSTGFLLLPRSLEKGELKGEVLEVVARRVGLDAASASSNRLPENSTLL
jgi:hypothetical protein